MKKFTVSFVYREECYDDVYEGVDEDDVADQVAWGYEAEAFYDNHYVHDLVIEEIK